MKSKIKTIPRSIAICVVFLSLSFSQPGKLKVGFDIDDTVLYSEPMFIHYVENHGRPIDYNWINANDHNYSTPITPTIDLIHYFKSNGHEVYFITARPGVNGQYLAEFLTEVLGYKVEKDVDLFFMPKEKIDGNKFTTKHRKMNEIGLDLYYGDSDTDIIAALKAGVHPVRVVRSDVSLEKYGSNYFGNTHKGDSKQTPFNSDDLQTFYSKSVGIFGESIYPIIWEEPNEE